MKLEVQYNPQKIAFIMALVALVLTVLSLTGDVTYIFSTKRFGLDIFKVDKHHSISTWYASGLLLVNSIVLIFIVYFKKNERKFIFHWILLVIIFAGLSLFKTTSFHSFFFNIIRKTASRLGVRLTSFVMAGTLIMVFALGFLKFLLSLPKRIKKLIFIAGLVYVGGSISMMIPGSRAYHSLGSTSLTYSIFSGFEQLFEMLGSIIFCYALMLYIKIDFHRILMQNNTIPAEAGADVSVKR